MKKSYKQADFSKPETWRKLSLGLARREFIRKLQDENSMQFVDYCAKIIIFPNDIAVNEWKHEMYTKVEWIQYAEFRGGKITRKLIKDKFFWLCTDINSFKAELDIMKSDCITLYGYKHPVEYESGINEIFKNYWEFCDKITDYLSAKQLSESIFLSLADKYLSKAAYLK